MSARIHSDTRCLSRGIQDGLIGRVCVFLNSPQHHYGALAAFCSQAFLCCCRSLPSMAAFLGGASL